MKKLIIRYGLNSPNIFLVDAIGAFLSGLGTTIIFFLSEQHFNYPIDSHRYLIFGLVMVFYSVNCYRFNLPLKPFLGLLILLNLSYLSFLTYLTIENIDSAPEPISLYFIVDGLAILLVILFEVLILKMNANNAQKGKSV